MISASWAEIAVRIIDYCQTRDAFLRATEATPEMVQMWAEELAATGQSEEKLREASSRAYQHAGGKPPADPLSAIVAEAKLIARDRASENWRDAILPPTGASSTGAVDSAYCVDGAINFTCSDHRSTWGPKPHRGCGAHPGEYCRKPDGEPAKTPHTARLLHADDALSPEQRQRRREESPTFGRR